MSDFLPVARPALDGNEQRYVAQCVETTWISSVGEFVERFERAFADYCGVAHAVSCSNGTTALHAALLGLGVGPGDEVLVPSLTYVATANAVVYCGAEPVFVDSDTATWNLDPADLAAKITPRTRAILPVHLYGKPAAMAEIGRIAADAGVPVLEDAAEAVGAEIDGRRAGALATAAAFSFFGNKILTCGEGGMVVTDDVELAARVRQIKGQGQDPERRYWFPIVGYNYRMTNIQAALGLAQLERIEHYLAARDEIAAWYRDELAAVPALSWPHASPGERSVNWLFSVVLDDPDPTLRDRVAEHLAAAGIETRPFFYPCHVLPALASTTRDPACPRSEWLSARGLSLPTWVGMSRADVERVAAELALALDALAKTGAL